MDSIHIIRKGDAGYPELLAHIPDPPEQLYCRGNRDLLETFCIGVVGTRKASDYGLQACNDIVSQLAASTITIVSGLASGIDTAAHRTALEHHGTTIAVFGTGVDDESIFPADNVGLAHEILQAEGLLISEYPPGTSGQQWTFPKRNRIISGISRGILVIEADKKSGSLITANCALEQDRDVFAVPGSIYWPRSVGTNWLIQQGARPVTSGTDIMQSYQLRQIPLPATDALVSTHDPVHQRILAILKDSGPIHMDAIVAQSGFETPRIIAALALLELYGTLKHHGAGIYSLCT